MPTEVLLPQWGMEMQDGTVIKWLKKEGDPVQRGEPLVEVETAKLSTEMESIASGVVAHILVPEGATVPIRTLLAIIAEPGEVVPRPASATPAVSASAAASAAPPPAAATTTQAQVSVQVVPAARRLAQQHEIDLSRVQGTGPRGRIMLEDVERAIEAKARGAPEVTPLTGMRKTIAERMLKSLLSMAQVTLTTEADVTDAMRLREGLARQWTEHGLTPLPFIIKATARALREHPQFNAVQTEGGIQFMKEVNIGIAVSLTDGLIVPVLRQVDEKGLMEITREARELASRTREKKVSYDEVTGGTFTITNLGVYEIDAFTPIINPPQVGILGVGRALEKPVIYQGEIAKRTMMFLSLTFDHRVVDGAPAAEFLRAIKHYLEDPWWMIA